jgi:hypothetical protein
MTKKLAAGYKPRCEDRQAIEAQNLLEKSSGYMYNDEFYTNSIFLKFRGSPR